MADTMNTAMLDRLIKETDIVRVISEYTELEQHGALFTGHCPLCNSGKNRLVVHPQRFLWRCFNCGRHGNVVDFLVDKECFNPVDAVKLLASKVFDRKQTQEHAKTAPRSPKPAVSAAPAVAPAPTLAVSTPPPPAPEGSADAPAQAAAPMQSFAPAENLFALLRSVGGYKTAVVLDDDLSLLAADKNPTWDNNPVVFIEFMQHFVTALRDTQQKCPRFGYTKGCQFTLRSGDGALIVVSDEYEQRLVHLMCLLSRDGNLVLTRRYMADLLAQQVFLT